MPSSAPNFSIDSLVSQPREIQEAFVNSLTTEELQALALSYDFLARPGQREPPGTWRTWMLLGGRGAGKTWVGANVTNRRARSGRYPVMALGAATPEDCRDIMIEGESGILATSAPDFVPTYEPSKKRITWPNGTRAHIRSGAEPERFRGLNSYFAWCDELAAWQYPQTAWDNLMLGLRRGHRPQCIVTTTPKPLHLIRELQKDPTCIVSTETSYANRANLSDMWWTSTVAKYEGTRYGEQEIMARVMDDIPGALWNMKTIEANRISVDEWRRRTMGRTVIAVDPAVTSSANSNETGIIAVSVGVGGWKDTYYVIRDVSGRHPVAKWPALVARTYEVLSADRVVAEVNNGGDLVEGALRVADPHIPFRKVTASRGKRARAEPVAALYEQGRVHHVGTFRELEDQMVTYIPDEPMQETLVGSTSPDRVDALVWGVSDLAFGPRAFLV